MLIARARVHKLLVRIANSEDTDQKQSGLVMCWLFKSFWQATSVHNFRTSTIYLTLSNNIADLQLIISCHKI